jgi:uncharacterized protein YndB with AHSA1/START domain
MITALEEGSSMGIRVVIVVTCLTFASVASGQSVAPLVHEGAIDAPIETVWRAWTTSEGLRSWLAPHAEIELKLGGTMRSNYNEAGSLRDAETIENTILSYEPERMLSIRVTKAPASFPFADTVGDMWTVVYFEPIGPNQTSVRVVSLGFTADPQSQAMRAFFDQGNAATIEQMRARLAQ